MIKVNAATVDFASTPVPVPVSVPVPVPVPPHAITFTADDNHNNNDDDNLTLLSSAMQGDSYHETWPSVETPNEPVLTSEAAD